jgi:hypothetical protein
MPSEISLAKRSANFSAGHGVGGLVCGVRKYPPRVSSGPIPVDATMCMPVARDSASSRERSRPWNIPVLSTIVPPPAALKARTWATMAAKISARSKEMS